MYKQMTLILGWKRGWKHHHVELSKIVLSHVHISYELLIIVLGYSSRFDRIVLTDSSGSCAVRQVLFGLVVTQADVGILRHQIT